MQDMSIRPVLKLTELRRTFRQGPREIHVLAGATAALYPGEAVALVGPSGAGKSTLLHVAGLLETPDAGAVIVNGVDCSRMSDHARTRIRRTEMGFVYQFHQLLAEFSALENVVIPQMIRGRSRKDAKARAKQLLTALGLGARIEHRPAELSGGEQQRVAIARALANQPKLLLADEPTGNLDSTNSRAVCELLRDLSVIHNKTIVMVTHEPTAAAYADLVLFLADGRIVDEMSSPTSDRVLDRMKGLGD